MSACIYIVDDEENIRELVSCALTSFGYRTECFETAEELLERCGSSVPDLILLDVMLPGISGTAALDILKKNINTRKIPVLLLTARSAETEKVAGLDKGADDYITKPFGILELSARVRAALRRSQTDGGSARIFANRDDMHRLIQNLLENAVKYNVPGGSAEICVKQQKNAVTVRVQDTGIGIEEKHLSRIFERFYRVDKGRSRSVGGTGLGLSIVRSIATAYHADIHAESKPGKGTVITVTFPAEKP